MTGPADRSTAYAGYGSWPAPGDRSVLIAAATSIALLWAAWDSPWAPNVPPMRRIVSRVAVTGLLVLGAGLAAAPSSASFSRPTLTGFASLPALTFVPGSE